MDKKIGLEHTIRNVMTESLGGGITTDKFVKTGNSFFKAVHIEPKKGDEHVNGSSSVRATRNVQKERNSETMNKVTEEEQIDEAGGVNPKKVVKPKPLTDKEKEELNPYIEFGKDITPVLGTIRQAGRTAEAGKETAKEFEKGEYWKATKGAVYTAGQGVLTGVSGVGDVLMATGVGAPVVAAIKGAPAAIRAAPSLVKTVKNVLTGTKSTDNISPAASTAGSKAPAAIAPDTTTTKTPATTEVKPPAVDKSKATFQPFSQQRTIGARKTGDRVSISAREPSSTSSTKLRRSDDRLVTKPPSSPPPTGPRGPTGPKAEKKGEDLSAVSGVNVVPMPKGVGDTTMKLGTDQPSVVQLKATDATVPKIKPPEPKRSDPPRKAPERREKGPDRREIPWRPAPSRPKREVETPPHITPTPKIPVPKRDAPPDVVPHRETPPVRVTPPVEKPSQIPDKGRPGPTVTPFKAPETAPVKFPAARPVVFPGAYPAASPATRTSTDLAPVTSTQPAAQTAAQPAAQPAAQTATQPAVNAAAAKAAEKLAQRTQSKQQKKDQKRKGGTSPFGLPGITPGQSVALGDVGTFGVSHYRHMADPRRAGFDVSEETRQDIENVARPNSDRKKATRQAEIIRKIIDEQKAEKKKKSTATVNLNPKLKDQELDQN
jgi:hypothetical protein